MEDQFSRMRKVLGEDAPDRLAKCRVAVFGLGGVGGYAVEALARAGVGALDLVDSDRIALSNLNRQILATHATVGRYKTDVACERVLDINPDCSVTVHRVFYLPETRGLFDFARYDYVVDAIDTVAAKLSLIEQAQAAGTPVICALGAGNKLDPTAFRVADIYETSVCPLAKVIRTQCRRRGIRSLKVVYSREEPVHPAAYADAEDGAEPGRQRRSTPGSVSFVPPVMGLILAGEVVKDLLAAPARKDPEAAAGEETGTGDARR